MSSAPCGLKASTKFKVDKKIKIQKKVPELKLLQDIPIHEEKKVRIESYRLEST